MLRDIAPEIPVVFINTGFHFPETLAYRDEIQRRFGHQLVELAADHAARASSPHEHGLDLYARNPDLCCHINKVEPLKRLSCPGVRAWDQRAPARPGERRARSIRIGRGASRATSTR